MDKSRRWRATQKQSHQMPKERKRQRERGRGNSGEDWQQCLTIPLNSITAKLVYNATLRNSDLWYLPLLPPVLRNTSLVCVQGATNKAQTPHTWGLVANATQNKSFTPDQVPDAPHKQSPPSRKPLNSVRAKFPQPTTTSLHFSHNGRQIRTSYRGCQAYAFRLPRYMIRTKIECDLDPVLPTQPSDTDKLYVRSIALFSLL